VQPVYQAELFQPVQLPIKGMMTKTQLFTFFNVEKRRHHKMIRPSKGKLMTDSNRKIALPYYYYL